MQDTNIQLIEKARNYLEESQHEACFGALDTFFKKLNAPRVSPIHQLHNQLRVVKTRYKNLIQQKTHGTISNEDYSINFNNISLALYAFFDSVIDETERLVDNNTPQEGTLQNNTVNIILVLNGNFDDFSEDNAIKITTEIRHILGLKEEEFKYLKIEQGSILIHVEVERSYELLIKLKSLVELNIIDNSVSIQSDDVVMDRLCLAMKNLELNISQINLSGADLSGIDLSEANLIGANLAETNLSKTDLSKMNLSGIDLSGANLSQADFSYANFTNARLVKANLSGANLHKANLSEASLHDADLSGADLSQTDLSNVKPFKTGKESKELKELRDRLRSLMRFLSEEDLLEIRFLNPNLSGADLSGANLSGIDLSGVNLSKANLSGANLSKTDLSEANLLKARLTNLDFSQTTLNKTIFHIDQEIELMQTRADTSQCVVIDDFGKNVGASIHT